MKNQAATYEFDLEENRCGSTINENERKVYACAVCIFVLLIVLVYIAVVGIPTVIYRLKLKTASELVFTLEDLPIVGYDNDSVAVINSVFYMKIGVENKGSHSWHLDGGRYNVSLMGFPVGEGRVLPSFLASHGKTVLTAPGSTHYMAPEVRDMLAKDRGIVDRGDFEFDVYINFGAGRKKGGPEYPYDVRCSDREVKVDDRKGKGSLHHLRQCSIDRVHI